MPFQLLDLEVDEIAFVDKGAGVGVKVALFKRRKESHVNELAAKMLKALTAIKADEKILAKFEDLAKQGVTLEDIKAKLTVEEWEVLMMALAEAAAPTGEATPGEMTVAGEGDESEREKDEHEDEDEDEEPEKTDHGEDDEDEEEMAKHTKELEKNREDLAKAQARIEKLEKAARFEKFLKEADAFKYAPGTTAEIAKQLMHADDVESTDKDLAKSMRTTIEMAHEERKSSMLLKSFGSGTPDLEDDNSIHGQLVTKAATISAEVRKSSNGKPLTKAQAYMAACKENPDLYRRLSDENRMRAMGNPGDRND